MIIHARTGVIRACGAAALGFALVAVAPAFGASGEAWVVARDGVNMREGPGKDHAVLTTLARGQAMTEIGRDGDWIQVTLADAASLSGWVHRTLVAPPPPPGTEPETDASVPSALDTLQSAVEQLNLVARNQGYDFFGAVRDLGGGGAEIVATEQWLASPEGFRAGNFNALEGIWRAAAQGPAWLRIVDATGATAMQSATATAPPEVDGTN